MHYRRKRLSQQLRADLSVLISEQGSVVHPRCAANDRTEHTSRERKELQRLASAVQGLRKRQSGLRETEAISKKPGKEEWEIATQNQRQR